MKHDSNTKKVLLAVKKGATNTEEAALLTGLTSRQCSSCFYYLMQTGIVRKVKKVSVIVVSGAIQNGGVWSQRNIYELVK